MDWAKHRKHKAAAKVHVALDLISFIPIDGNETKTGKLGFGNTKNGKISKNTLLGFQKIAILPLDKQN